MVIDLKCSFCEQPFVRAASPKFIRLDRKVFCSRKCSASSNNNKIGSAGRDRRKEYAPFLQFARQTQHKNHQWNEAVGLSVEYLKEIWDNQSGKCVYTKLPMTLNPKARNKFREGSLDRIDSSKGYIEGNVHFVCRAINFAKQDGTDAEMREFIEMIKRPSNVEKRKRDTPKL